MSNQEPTQEPLKSPSSKPATLELCHQLIEEQVAQIESLSHRLLAQEEALALLQEKLKLNSRNSSKPPEFDSYERKSLILLTWHLKRAPTRG